MPSVRKSGKKDDVEAKWKLLAEENDDHWSSSDSEEVEFENETNVDKLPAPKAKNGIYKTTSTNVKQVSFSRFFLTTAVITIFILIIALIIVLVAKPNLPCLTPKCIEASATLMKNMNRRYDPCGNYFDYACGQWIKDNPVPPGEQIWSRLHILVEKSDHIKHNILISEPKIGGKTSTSLTSAQNQFKACMNREKREKYGINSLIKLIKDLGSWSISPNLTGKWIKEKWKYLNTLVEIHKMDSFPLFEMSLEVDARDTNKYAITFQQSGLTFGKPTYYDGKIGVLAKKGFLNAGEGLGKVFGLSSNEVKKKFEDIWDFEVKLSQVFNKETFPKNSLQSQNQVPLSNFSTISGKKTNMVAYLLSSLDTNKLPKYIYVDSIDYFQKLASLIQATDNEVLANYMIFYAIRPLFTKLNLAMLDVNNVLWEPLIGKQHEVQNLWKKCMQDAYNGLKFAVSAVYVEKYFNKTSLTVASKVVDYVKDSLEQRIQHAKWLDASSRIVAYKKIKELKTYIGYPNWLIEQEKVDHYYAKLNELGDNFFENSIALKKYFKTRNTAYFFMNKTKREQWDFAPLDIQAYYSVTFNQIFVPAAMLQNPLFDMDFPMALNFGGIGMIVGHELTHGFDKIGQYHDEFGNMKRWWSKSAQENFNKQVTCFEKQYSSYSLEGNHIDGKSTVNENIADNGGLRVAYNAYINWKIKHNNLVFNNLPGFNGTDNQYFFLSYAQSWCASHSKEYSKMMWSDNHAPFSFRKLATIQTDGPYLNKNTTSGVWDAASKKT